MNAIMRCSFILAMAAPRQAGEILSQAKFSSSVLNAAPQPRKNSRTRRTVKTEIERLLETRQKDFDAHLGQLGTPRVCNGEIDASVRLHFVLADASGEPRVRELASMLVGYITKYCFDATKRKDLDEVDRNLLFVEARDLFRKAAKSGQAGELLIYFLLEAVLKAPQALRKMVITTNPKDERKGSDGMHFSWNQDLEILELYFAESKVWNDFGAALSDAIASVEKFHNDV